MNILMNIWQCFDPLQSKKNPFSKKQFTYFQLHSSVDDLIQTTFNHVEVKTEEMVNWQQLIQPAFDQHNEE